MNTSEHNNVTERLLALKRGGLDVRWTRLTYSALESATNGRPRHHEPQALVLSMQLLPDDHAVLEAWLEHPGGRRQVLDRAPFPCRATVDQDMIHLDCTHDGRRLLALTIDGEGEIAYARSVLLADAGFSGGSFDPPSLRPVTVAASVASA
jgi:hypothetical protein